MVTYLRTHSYYSLLRALPSPEELVHAASKAGVKALALTDFRNLTGAASFYQACRREGIQPIIGMDLELSGPIEPGTLTLLSAGSNGWRNLCRIATRLNLREDPDSPASTFDLSTETEDLIAMPGNLVDPDGKLLGLLNEMFPGRLYVGLDGSRSPGSNRSHQLAAAARKLNISAAAVCPSAYLDPQQSDLLRVLAAVRSNQPMDRLPANFIPIGGLFLDPADFTSRFRENPEALFHAEELAERCQVELPLGKPHYPKVPLHSGSTAFEVLRSKAESGARRLYGKITPEIQRRLDHELEVITQQGYEPIFLIMEEIVSHAQKTGVPISSRGSAASSLVAHCLGITSPDPIALDLTFERFLNPARSTPPDIDTDICSRRRHEIIKHVFDTYGEDQVAMVGTINRFRPRSALGETAKAYGLSPQEVRSLVNALPHHWWHRHEEDEESTPPNPFDLLIRRFPQYKQIFADASALLRLPRHFSVHAGGIVVSPCPLRDLVPLQRSGSKEVIITQIDHTMIESFGLIKLDLLGIRGLTVLGDVAEVVHSWRRSEFRSAMQVLDQIPNEDPETSQRIIRGQTIGCFQIESPGMRATLREIQAKNIEDIVAALALYRPGPLQGGLKDAFVRRFKGDEPIEHLHPSLSSLLDKTFGVILYQEQVLRIAYDLAGFSWAEADLLRRAMSHFDPGKQMQVLKEKFIAGAYDRHQVPPETGARIWELMAAFAGYGFPKAHAASYAQVAWRSTWCKTHHPAEFMAAVLANWGGYYSQSVYLSEARRMGLKLRPPSVNHARREFSVAYPQGEPVLYMGLDQVRELSHRTIETILRRRPFHSLEDFLARADPNPQEAENLAYAGALDSFGTIPQILNRLKQSGWKPDQLSLFPSEAADIPDWTLAQRVAAQQNILGVSIDAHPLELFASSISAAGACTTQEAVERVGERVTIAAVRQISHRSRTTSGEIMLFLTLEDLEGMLDAVVYPDTFRRLQIPQGSQVPLFISGIMEMDTARGEPILRVEKVSRIDK